MFTTRRVPGSQLSALALWGALASVPPVAEAVAPTIRGAARLDAVLAGFVSEPERRCLNNSSGNFSCASFNTLDSSFGITLGDLDNDGDLDALMANFNTQVERRCLNNGSGGLSNCVSFNRTDNTDAIALGDLDGDGDLDAVLANDNAVEQRCLNDGSGGFTACASFNLTDRSYSVALGDLDGDGDLDAVIANYGAAEQRCLNDGSGGFASCTSFGGTTDDSTAIVLGDLDNDGDLDAVIANGNTSTGQVEQRCLNDGSGGFTACASFNLADRSFSIALGDLDGDGDLDAVIANHDAVEQRCLNNGSGDFVSCASFNGIDRSYGITLGDVDGDGDLDAVIANGNYGSGQVEQRCLNNGAGGFTACASFNTVDNSSAVALGKLDNDGLVDVTSSFAGGVTTSNFSLTLASMVTGYKPAGLVALYQFDTQYCRTDLLPLSLSNLRTRTIRITQGNTLNFGGLTAGQHLTAPEWRAGGIGAELLVPQTGGYALGLLLPGGCATITYKFNLFSLSKYKFALRIYGTTLGLDTLPDSVNANPGAPGVNDLAAESGPALELDLGALQASPETPAPGTSLPGGTAPVTPVLSFPAGTSNLPSRR